MNQRGRTSVVELVALAGAFGAILWAAEYSADRLVPRIAAAVQTSGIPAVHTPCTLPTEHEQMVVVLYWRDGKLLHRCMFTGSRGTYSKPLPKGPTT